MTCRATSEKALAGAQKPLQGLRVGVVREDKVKHAPNDVAISDAVDEQIKTVLRDTLGAEIVESVDPLYPDDADVPNMRYTFQDALSETLPLVAPEYFCRGAMVRSSSRCPGTT